MEKNKDLIIESLVFIIVSLAAFLYVRKNNPDNVIERYYKARSEVLYSLFKISSVIIKLKLIFNIKYLILLIIKSYILIKF
mgnify:CR=1 FL=1